MIFESSYFGIFKYLKKELLGTARKLLQITTENMYLNYRKQRKKPQK